MICRRVRKSEQTLLERLCEDDTTWAKYYHSNHTRWVSKALQDVLTSEDRVVIGAFDSYHDEGDTGKNKLIGCLFLKKLGIENVIELKSLIVSDEVENLREAISKRIIEKAIRFCEIRGIEKIEIELPQQENSIISVFLSLHFRITGSKSRFNSSINVYLLEKTIGEKYYGDPYDIEEFGKWLLSQYVSCNILAEYVYNRYLKVSFESKSMSAAFLNNEVGQKKRLKGTLWIVEHPEDGSIETDLNYIIKDTDTPALKMLVIDRLTLKEKEKFQKNNFTVFDKEDCKIIAGGIYSSMSIPFLSDNIGGAVTVLEYEKVLEYYKFNTTTYYLFNGTSKALSIYENTDSLRPLELGEGFESDMNNSKVENPILAVFCPNWKDREHGLVGFFEVVNLNDTTFETILNEPISKDSALSFEDLKFYKIYSENQRVCKLNCGKLFLFQNPVSIRYSELISSDDARDYLYREIADNQNNLAYIDVDTRNNLRKLKTELLNKSDKMILETIATAIGIISESVTIADYSEKKYLQLKSKLSSNDGQFEAAVAKSRLKRLIEVEVYALEEAISDYEKTRMNPAYKLSDKDTTCKSIAYNAINVLKKLEPFKGQIEEYDETLKFFSSVVQD